MPPYVGVSSGSHAVVHFVITDSSAVLPHGSAPDTFTLTLPRKNSSLPCEETRSSFHCETHWSRARCSCLSQVFLLSNVKPSRPIGQRRYFTLCRGHFTLVQRVSPIPCDVIRGYSLRRYCAVSCLCGGRTSVCACGCARPLPATSGCWVLFVLLCSQGAGRLLASAP